MERAIILGQERSFWDEDNDFGTRALILGRGRSFWDEDGCDVNVSECGIHEDMCALARVCGYAMCVSFDCVSGGV